MEIILRIILINLLCIIFPYIAFAENNSKTVIKIIDKVSGKYYIHEVSKDKLLIFRNLVISSSQCIIDKDDANNFAAFVSLKNINQKKYIFKGWILSKNVSLSQVSHSVYNVKLLRCF